MNFIINKRGFTLLELLIAIGTSAIIILAIYGLFNTLFITRVYLDSKKDRAEVLTKVALLLQKDIRCKIGTFEIEHIGDETKLSFYTTNSLFFNGAFPVKVSYFLERHNNRNIFYREEVSEGTGLFLKIPLTDLFKEVRYEFFSHGIWEDSNVSEIVRITLKTETSSYSLTERSIIEG